MYSDKHIITLADANASGYKEFISSLYPGLQIPILEMEGGENCKNLNHARQVWQFMTDQNATRHTILLCIGGGSITDLGGFCASTFKRGLPHINVPTTLLGAVDAAIGGKTGIDFMNLKNQIGTFKLPLEVIIEPKFFLTLPAREILSGYAEALKTAYIDGTELFEKLIIIGNDILANKNQLFGLARELAEIKQRIVDSDPEEKDERRVLNMGHTIGHALESMYAEKQQPISHGHAVMAGLVAESLLSVRFAALDSSIPYTLAKILKTNYHVLKFDCSDYPHLLQLMRHDKKNPTPEAISFTISSEPGKWENGIIVNEKEIETALDIFRDLTGI